MTKIHGNSTYTEELAEEICQAIASSSDGMRKLCKENHHWPEPQIIYGWLRKHPKFAQQYAQAKVAQVDIYVDEIVQISDDGTNDSKVLDNGTEVCNSDWIARSRLRVDTRKWLAGKLVPKVYGSKGIEITAEGSLLEKFIDKL